MSTRKSLAFSFLDRYSGLILAIISSMILARLLTPAQIGVFSVTQVLLSYIGNLRDMGAGYYLLQEKELTQERIRATWTVQLGLGLTFALVVLLAAGPAAAFYEQPIMRDIMLVLAANFAIGPFGSLTYAWLMREMRFDLLAVMRLGGSLAGGCTSVALAWLGFGPISLAFGSLAATIVNAGVAVVFRPAAFPWLPGFKEIRRVLAFGTQLTMTTIVTTFASSVAELMLGKFQGMTATGLYSRANGLAAMFARLVMDATQAVALPLFARGIREQGNIDEDFIRAASYTTVIGWTFFLGLIFLAEPVIRLLYGTQWSASVPVCRLLAAGMALGLPAALCPTALTAAGEIRIIVRATLVSSAQLVIFVGRGAMMGLIELGYAYILANLGASVIWIAYTRKPINLSLRRYFRALALSAVVAAMAAVAPAAAYFLFDPLYDGVVRPLIFGGLGGTTLMVLAALLVKHPICHELHSVSNKLQKHLARAQ